MNAPQITVIGDLLEDVVVWTTAPTRSGTDNPAVVHRSRGGSAANAAVAVAGAGGRSRFIGCVGDDAAGDALVAALQRAAVDVRVQRRGATGTVVVLVDAGGERTMFPDRAAAAQLTEIDPVWLEGTDVLHLPAYGFLGEASAAALRSAAMQVRAAGGRVSVDASATSAIDAIGVDEFLSLIGALSPDLLLANADEARLLGLGRDGRVPPRGATYVVKRGALPVLVIGDDGSVAEVPAERVHEVRDTTGAGDAFAGALLTSWAAGVALADAVRAGHAAAAAVLRTPGAG